MRRTHHGLSSVVSVITVAVGLVLGASSACSAGSVASSSGPVRHVVGEWNAAALQGIRDARLGAPMVARALAIVHTCMYDAWAAFDEHAVGTQLAGALRRPVSERTFANKQEAISYAAYRALVDVLPADMKSVYRP